MFFFKKKCFYYYNFFIKKLFYFTVENFENMLNQGIAVGKDIEENEKVLDTLDVKEDFLL